MGNGNEFTFVRLDNDNLSAEAGFLVSPLLGSIVYVYVCDIVCRDNEACHRLN